MYCWCSLWQQALKEITSLSTDATTFVLFKVHAVATAVFAIYGLNVDGFDRDSVASLEGLGIVDKGLASHGQDRGGF